MKRAWATAAVVSLFLLACGAWQLTPTAGQQVAFPKAKLADEPAPVTARESVGEVPGKTQPVPGRMGQIAPAALHPVTRVLVSPGERVKAGQPLVELDSDEPAADVRAKKAAVT